jgi:hypothetical protein
LIRFYSRADVIDWVTGNSREWFKEWTTESRRKYSDKNEAAIADEFAKNVSRIGIGDEKEEVIPGGRFERQWMVRAVLFWPRGYSVLINSARVGWELGWGTSINGRAGLSESRDNSALAPLATV